MYGIYNKKSIFSILLLFILISLLFANMLYSQRSKFVILPVTFDIKPVFKLSIEKVGLGNIDFGVIDYSGESIAKDKSVKI